MKKIAVTLFCSVMAFSIFAAEPKAENVDVEKKIIELQAERYKVRNTLIKKRRAAIRKDKYAAKLAREILVLNQELSEYLDTIQDIKELNRNLSSLDQKIRELEQIRSKQDKNAKKAEK